MTESKLNLIKEYKADLPVLSKKRAILNYIANFTSSSSDLSFLAFKESVDTILAEVDTLTSGEG